MEPGCCLHFLQISTKNSKEFRTKFNRIHFSVVLKLPYAMNLFINLLNFLSSLSNRFFATKFFRPVSCFPRYFRFSSLSQFVIIFFAISTPVFHNCVSVFHFCSVLQFYQTFTPIESNWNLTEHIN